MPNTSSAKKRMRSSAKAAELNLAAKTRVKTTRRKFLESLESGDKAAGEKTFREYCSVLDNAAKRGVIKKNTSIRRKTRASKKLTPAK